MRMSLMVFMFCGLSHALTQKGLYINRVRKILNDINRQSLDTHEVQRHNRIAKQAIHYLLKREKRMRKILITRDRDRKYQIWDDE